MKLFVALLLFAAISMVVVEAQIQIRPRPRNRVARSAMPDGGEVKGSLVIVKGKPAINVEANKEIYSSKGSTVTLKVGANQPIGGKPAGYVGIGATF